MPVVNGIYYAPKKKKDITELYGHTRKRLLERYNADISKGTYRKISKAIRRCQKEGLKYIGASSYNRTIWHIQMLGYDFIGVYDKKRHLLVTALPKDLDTSALIKYDAVYLERLKTNTRQESCSFGEPKWETNQTLVSSPIAC